MILGNDPDGGALFFPLDSSFNFSAVAGVYPITAGEGADDHIMCVFANVGQHIAAEFDNGLGAVFAGAVGEFAGEDEEATGKGDRWLRAIEGQGGGCLDGTGFGNVAGALFQEVEQFGVFFLVDVAVTEKFVDSGIDDIARPMLGEGLVAFQPVQQESGLGVVDHVIGDDSSAQPEQLVDAAILETFGVESAIEGLAVRVESVVSFHGCCPRYASCYTGLGR